MDKKKPTVLISKCIEHGYCRYDGGKISSDFVKELEDYVDFITVCPEVEINLPVPREGLRIVTTNSIERLVFFNSGTDVTDEMVKFSKEYIQSLKDINIHGCILKELSPSCGFEKVKVFQGLGKQSCLNEKTQGFFGREVVKKYQNLPIEDEGRLRNYNIREQFLTAIFTLKDFDEVIKDNSIKSLIDFQSKNKYLLMQYNQINQKLMGSIVSNGNKNQIETMIQEYLVLLKKSLATPLTRGTNTNMLMHIFGYFKNDLTKEEKAYFTDILEEYTLKKVPYSVPLSVLYTWVLRFDESYLKTQTVFKPYPIEILDVADSGKGID